MVIDAPSVLPWNSYREADTTDAGSGLPRLRECLEGLHQQRVIVPIPLDALAHLLSGAVDEAAVWVAQSDNPQKALKDAKLALTKLLEGIRGKDIFLSRVLDFYSPNKL